VDRKGVVISNFSLKGCGLADLHRRIKIFCFFDRFRCL